MGRWRKFEISKIVPIFKSDDECEASNSTPLTIKYFLMNLIIMAFEEKLTTGFHPPYHIVYKQRKLAR